MSPEFLSKEVLGLSLYLCDRENTISDVEKKLSGAGVAAQW